MLWIWTNHGDGIIEADYEILNTGTPRNRKVVVLATDGTMSSGTIFSDAIMTIQNAGIDEFGVIAIDDMSVLDFYSPFIFGGGTAEFAATFTEFQDILEQYCQRVVIASMPMNVIPTMGEWGLICLTLLFLICLWRQSKRRRISTSLIFKRQIKFYEKVMLRNQHRLFSFYAFSIYF